MEKKHTKNNNKIIRALSIIGDFIFVPVIIVMIILCFFLLVCRFNNSLPTVFNNTVITVLSDSMNPEFKKGDTVLIKKITAEELKKGDIIAFYRYSESEAPSVIWFHRIVGISYTEDGYIAFQTKGDNNLLPDNNWTREDYVVGVYNSKGVLIHKFLTFAVTRAGIVCMVILPAGLIFMFEGVVMINLIDKKIKIKNKGEQK